MNYKRQIKNTIRYYDHWINIYKEEKEIYEQDIEEIMSVIKQLKIEISDLYEELNSKNQTRKEDIRIYQSIRNKEDEKRDLIRERRDLENTIKRLEAKIARINQSKNKVVIC